MFVSIKRSMVPFGDKQLSRINLKSYAQKVEYQFLKKKFRYKGILLKH